MSLSDDLRRELAAIAPARECDALAELSGLFHAAAGSFHLRGKGEVAAHLDLGSSAAARRAFSLLRGLGVASELRTYRRRAFARETRYQLHVEGGRALQVLHEAGVLTARLGPLEQPPLRVVARKCCRAAYLRGALLAGGSVTGPRAAHLEIRTAGLAGARFLADVAAREGGGLAVVDRGRHALAYAKGADAIADVLAAAGASETVLVFAEGAVLADTRARANRLANADHANLVRASRAAREQLRAVERLRRNGGLETLPPALREIAELRLENPSLSLRELAERCSPPVTKAAAHRRLRKLQRLAEA